MNLALPKRTKTISKEPEKTRSSQKDLAPEATQKAGSLLDIKLSAEDLRSTASCTPFISAAQIAYFLLLSRRQ